MMKYVFLFTIGSIFFTEPRCPFSLQVVNKIRNNWTAHAFRPCAFSEKDWFQPTSTVRGAMLTDGSAAASVRDPAQDPLHVKESLLFANYPGDASAFHLNRARLMPGQDKGNGDRWHRVVHALDKGLLVRRHVSPQ
jgi:hypothetical protein